MMLPPHLARLVTGAPTGAAGCLHVLVSVAAESFGAKGRTRKANEDLEVRLSARCCRERERKSVL